MFDFFRFILENWQIILNLGFMIFLLGMVPTITVALRNAKNGIRESLTPMGFLVLIIMVILFFLVKNLVTNL